MVLAANLVQTFTELSSNNTLMKTETGGLLFGQYEGDTITIDKLLIPKQEGRGDFWKASDEAEIGSFSEAHPNLKLFGTIHTHPGFSSKTLQC